MLDDDQKRRAISFGSIAQDYDRSRPGPPNAALDWLLPTTVDAVGEIGAGTGLLTRKLVWRATDVFAVEPDARMRAHLAERSPTVHVLDGRGESVPLPDASLSALLAASSWHWVDQVQGFAEAARLLRPGGVLGLMWSGPDRDVDWVPDLMSDPVTPDAPAAPQRMSQRHRPVMPEGAPFREPERQVFRATQRMSVDDLSGLPLTYSRAIALDPERRQALFDHAAGVGRQHVEADTGEVELPIACIAWRAVRA